MTSAVIQAAGGVVWRFDTSSEHGEVEVAIIHRPRYDDWSMPKGKLLRDETFVEGAVREVTEETGLRVKLGRPLGEITYEKVSGGVARPKVVRYWAMHAEGGLFTPGNEVDQLRWVPLGVAFGMLTHERDREVLERFAGGPVLTRTVLLVRHGLAGSRSKWKGDDRLRPLDDDGALQAEELVWLLTRWDVREIVAADFRRCVQTVEPLAAALGLSIKEEPLFAEDVYPGREDDAVEQLRSLGSETVGTVVCSQGGVVPDLLTRLTAADGVHMPEGFAYKKGSVWALTFDGPALIDAEYFPPPEL